MTDYPESAIRFARDAALRPIAALDVPLPVLTLQLAAVRSHSPSDRIAYALDEWLIGHPTACSTDDAYPAWAAELATRPTFFRTKETP